MINCASKKKEELCEDVAMKVLKDANANAMHEIRNAHAYVRARNGPKSRDESMVVVHVGPK